MSGVKRPIGFSVFPICLMAVIGSRAWAAEWTNSASVTPGVTYTDNVCLSKNDTQDEWIGTVTPAATMIADGSRVNLSVDGSVEVNTLTDSRLRDLGCTGGNRGSREQFAPRLNGTADAILVENWFYFDATAYINQNSVTPYASGGGDSFNRTGNTNTTYSYSVSPYIARRFKDTAELNLRYTFDDQYNSSDAVRDSTEDRVQASLGSVPGVSKYSWGIQGDYSNVNYSNSPRIIDNNQDSELKSAQINQGYQLNRRWQLNGFYGQEWNDFVSNRDDIDGTFWDVGLRWTPNVRTTVDAGVGDRFFGNNPRFAITHRHKRSAFSANYAKTLTYDRNIRTLQESPPLNPGLPPPPGIDPGVTSLSNSPILDERFTLGYSWQGLRTSIGVSAFQSEQTKRGGSAPTFTDSTYTGVAVSANRDLSRQTSLRAGVNWNEQDPKNSNGNVENQVINNSETWSGSLGINRQLSQRTNLGLNYVYTDRQSDGEFNTYTENRITLDLRVDL
jgi:hypothetical protein